MFKLVFSSVLALVLIMAVTVQADDAAIAQQNELLKAQNELLRNSIEDLKRQSARGSIGLDKKTLTDAASGGFTVAVLSYFASGFVRNLEGRISPVGVRLLGYVCVGGMVTGGVVAIAAGLASAIVPSPANAGELTRQFETPGGFQLMMTAPTDTILHWTEADPDLARVIIELDAHVRDMQGRI